MGPAPWWFLITYLAYFSTVLLAILCILIIARTVFAPAEARRGATCGACGHQITELAPGRCPECGALLLKAGLTTRAMLLRHRGSLAAALIAWTALVVTVSSWGGSALVQSMAFQQTSGQGKVRLIKDQSFEPGPPFEPSPRYTIRFDLNVVLTNNDIDSGEIEIALRVPGKPKAVAIIDRDVMTCTVTDPAGKQVWTGPDFEHQAAVALYSAAGLDPADRQTGKEISALYELVQMALADPQSFESTFWNSDMSEGSSLLRSTGGGASSSPVGEGSGLPTWAIASMVSVLVVYVAGCIALILLRRRVVAQLYAGLRESTPAMVEPTPT